MCTEIDTESSLSLPSLCYQLLQPGETPLETVRNITLRGDVEVRPLSSISVVVVRQMGCFSEF